MKNTLQISDGSEDVAVKEELNNSIAIADVDLEDKNKLETGQTLKTAKTKRKNSAQSPSARRTKKLKTDEEANKASSLESRNNSTEIPSTSAMWEGACKEEENKDDFTCGQPPLKKVKTETCPQGQPVRLPENISNIEEVEMNWDIVQVCTALFCHFSLILFDWYEVKEDLGVFSSLATLPVVPVGFGSWVCCLVL